MGYPDKAIERISGQKILTQRTPRLYKMVDTCAAEFGAETPYFYSTYDEENEATHFIAEQPRDKQDGNRVRLRARSGSARALNSTILRCTASGR